jgi:hypothetical protein
VRYLGALSLLLIGLLAGLLALLPSDARAEATPVQSNLTYLPDVSNFPTSESASDPPPAMLPNTGGAEPDYPKVATRSEWLANAGLEALTLAIGLGAGFVLGKQHGH